MCTLGARRPKGEPWWSQRDQEGRREMRFLGGPGLPCVPSGSLPRTAQAQAPRLVSLVSAGPEERQVERRGLAGEVETTHSCWAEAPPFARWLTWFYTTFRSLAPTPSQMPPVELVASFYLRAGMGCPELQGVFAAALGAGSRVPGSRLCCPSPTGSVASGPVQRGAHRPPPQVAADACSKGRPLGPGVERGCRSAGTRGPGAAGGLFVRCVVGQSRGWTPGLGGSGCPSPSRLGQGPP